tara:strand:+ start:100 stop:261 length:162 start_codon:yes stop_codon:yes gene_type:complete
MNKAEMIAEIESLCKANKNNPYCSVFWLADMIKEIVNSPDLIEPNKSEENEDA